jgi:tetratricopeptide (TPR) repeat protein
VARLEQRASQLNARGRHRAAARTYRKLCRFDPAQPDHRFGLMVSWLRAGRPERALEAARKVWRHPATTPPLRAAVLRRLGNSAWRRGRRERAAELFEAAARLPVPEGTARDLAVRRWAVAKAQRSRRLRPLLAPRRDESPAPSAWEALAEAYPREGLVQYLVGSWHRYRGRWDASARYLRRALSLGLPDERFRREALLRLGFVHVRALRFQRARAVFARLDVEAEPAAVRIEARDWMQRCDFFTRHATTLGLVATPGDRDPDPHSGVGG